jgi:hypothetical protein
MCGSMGCISSIIKFWRSSSVVLCQGSVDDTIVTINSTLFGHTETEGSSMRGFVSSFDSS